jgi:hypothetical protein
MLLIDCKWHSSGSEAALSSKHAAAGIPMAMGSNRLNNAGI